VILGEAEAMANSVLLIDKSKSHAQALKTYLERRQAEVSIASTNDEVLVSIEKNKPEILIADPYLPDGEIVYILKQIKKSQPLTQIIIITEPAYIDQAMEAFQHDVASYLPRPVKSQALNFALEQTRDRIAIGNKLIRYKKKIADLNDAQALYQQLFDEVPCYITVQDRDFRLTATNKMFKKDFGDEIGSHCFQIYKHRATRCQQCPVASTFEDGKPHSTEEIVTSKTGEQYNVITWTAPIRNSLGQISQVMEISTNITQIRQLQDHLTSLGLMLGSMSHGVKGMLTALDGGIYQLESGLNRQDPDRIQRAFDQVKQMAERIKKMVLEILYYAKSRELNYQHVDAVQMAEDIIETVKPMAKKNNVSLEVDISPSLGTLEVDPNWVQVAMVNILENAIDACINDPDKSEHQVLFKVFLIKPERLCYVIEDNGMGMDRETKEKMFTLFFSSKGSRGTGLGLFIAHHVIRQHGGKVQVESKPQDGSKFQICLPIRHPTQPLLANATREA
jgi:PAS domain S-box-containing protein